MTHDRIKTWENRSDNTTRSYGYSDTSHFGKPSSSALKLSAGPD